jgi:alanyl-tRNA synthetase
MFDKGRSFSAHIEKKKSKCDYKNFDRALTEEEHAEIEKRVNDVIAQNMSVQELFLTREEAGKKFNLERLPDEVGDEVRVIKIGDYDECPCIGVHVKSTSEIGKFKVVSSSFDNGIMRLRFKLEE